MIRIRNPFRKDILSVASTLAALAVTASAEFTLASAVGIPHSVAFAVPVALDAYCLRALQVHRDVAASVAAMIAVNAASHLVSAHLIPVSVPLVVATAAIAPLVLWRVHSLRPLRAPVTPSLVESTNVPAIGVQTAVQSLATVHPETVAELAAATEVPSAAIAATNAVDALVDASECAATEPDADPLIPDAFRVHSECVAKTGKGATLRTLQTELRIGQARAQRIRTALAA